MTARRDFEAYLQALRARLDRERRSATGREMDELYSLREAWGRDYQQWVRAGAPSPPGTWYIAKRPPAWEPLEVELAPDGWAAAPAREAVLGRPRQRPPEGLPIADVERLQPELEKRRANPGDSRYTQQAVAKRVGITRDRVEQAIRLEELGWPLLRSDPDFSAKGGGFSADGLVRWPRPEKAQQILGFERRTADSDEKSRT